MARRFIVESRLRLNPNTESTSNFTVNVPDVINVNKLRLVEATIPLTYYSINSTNNAFKFIEEDPLNPGSTLGIVTINIPPGNYSNTTIAAALSSAMTAGSLVPQVYTVNIDPITNILTISAPNPGGRKFQVTTVANITNPLSLGRILGLSTTVQPLSLTYTAPSVINLAGPNELYITSSIVNGPLEEVIILSSPDVTNIIDRIPIYQTTGTIQTLLQPDSRREIYIPNPDAFTVLDIQIRLPGGSIVELNNADVTLVFEFE